MLYILFNRENSVNCASMSLYLLLTVLHQSSVMSGVDMANPLLIRRPHIVWCIQQFNSELSDVAVSLLSRLAASTVPDSTKVHCIVFSL